MVIFPSHAKANVPPTVFLPGTCSVAVRINPKDDVERIRQYYGERLMNWEIEERSLHDSDLISKLKNHRVRISIDDCNAFQSSASLRVLSGLEAVFHLKPNRHLTRTLNLLTSLRFRAHIDTIVPAEDPQIIEKAADFYLHNPLLGTAIEPFHSILYSMTRRRAFTLWEIESEDPKTNFYVGKKGEISLGERWIDKGLLYGTIDDPWDQLRNSPLLSTLLSFRAELFRRRSQCTFCSHFEPCAGFLRATEGDWPCEPWQKAFSILHEGVEKATKLQQELQSST